MKFQHCVIMSFRITMNYYNYDLWPQIFQTPIIIFLFNCLDIFISVILFQLLILVIVRLWSDFN